VKVRDSKKTVNNDTWAEKYSGRTAKQKQKPLIESSGQRRTRSDYSLKAVEEEEQAEAEAVKARLNRPAPAWVSDLQSGVGKRKRFYIVPDWAGAVTPDFVERSVLGVVDYWLGLNPKGGVRARKAFRTRRDGFHWYVITAGGLARQIFGNVKQARRAVNRLHAKGLLRKEVHSRGGWNVALRLRLNWELIQQVVADEAGRGEDHGDDDG
jgi:hypothetical protein